MNTRAAVDYVNSVKDMLGKDVINELNRTMVGTHTLGYLTKQYVVDCFYNNVGEQDCVNNILSRLK